MHVVDFYGLRESMADRTARLLDSQAINLDVVDVSLVLSIDPLVAVHKTTFRLSRLSHLTGLYNECPRSLHDH
jgi:hypothetical protein